MSLLEISHLTTKFETQQGTVSAVRDVSYHLEEGEVLGIVGESGSGKSVGMLTLMGLLASNGRVEEGEILFDGNRIGMIFQDPMTFLNPILKIGIQMTEGIRKHQNCSKKEAEAKAIELMRQVGIPSPEKRLDQYPFEFSGGMRQRAALIRTLAMEPDLLLLDEPFSALDYQTRLNVCDDIGKIIKKEGKTAILVTHDISEAISMADRVIVLAARPAYVKKKIPIRFAMEERTPMKARSAPEFKTYFNAIWKELNENA